MSQILTSASLLVVPLESDVLLTDAAKAEKRPVDQNENSIGFLFSQKIEAACLKEKFLCATFEIIAEKGADGLSASELIKRTQSSKGALFHHFQTLDHLCIESLHFFRKNISGPQPVDICRTLEEYLKMTLQETARKQSSRYYIHLVNFFRDRAIRDERYREPLKQIFEVSIHTITNRVMEFLSPGVDREVVFKKVLFMLMAVERVSYHRALYQKPDACENEIQELQAYTIQSLKSLM